mmetsp:Transcript_38637/g.70303  ORF Transcript_38637/g.70303 Transcript_38637/m.70303 type:complete len:234 (+) Transcript_38637:174-875(+)
MYLRRTGVPPGQPLCGVGDTHCKADGSTSEAGGAYLVATGVPRTGLRLRAPAEAPAFAGGLCARSTALALTTFGGCGAGRSLAESCPTSSTLRPCTKSFTSCGGGRITPDLTFMGLPYDRSGEPSKMLRMSVMPGFRAGDTCRMGDHTRLSTPPLLPDTSTVGEVDNPRLSGWLAKSSVESALWRGHSRSPVGLEGLEFGVLEWQDVFAGYEQVLQAPLAWLASFTDSSVKPN